MVRGVIGNFYLDLKVGGEPIEANPTTLTQFQIINTIHQSLPSITIGFKDASGDLTRLFKYGDGTPIDVDVGVAGGHVYRGLKFAMLGTVRGSPTDSSIGLTLSGVLNNIGYLRKIVDKHVEGNSSDVFTKWAQEVGLQVDVDTTNDKMTWLPNRTSVAEYMKHVAERSFSSATSCLITAVTDTGVAKFKDLDKIIQGKAKRTFAHGPDTAGEDAIPIMQYEVASKTHVANSSRGYGATSMTNNMDGSVVELNKIDIRQLANAIPMSKEFTKVIGDLGNRIMQLPTPSGNTHDKWNEAIHNNKRIKSSYAFDIHVLTDTPSQVELLDLVKFRPMNHATRTIINELDGDYIVTAITKTIVKRTYLEKLTLTSQGTS